MAAVKKKLEINEFMVSLLERCLCVSWEHIFTFFPDFSVFCDLGKPKGLPHLSCTRVRRNGQRIWMKDHLLLFLICFERCSLICNHLLQRNLEL